jgi:Protein of unknown function (DUF4236)
MGFYIRKSVRVGPVRFNLSKSGVGMSVGVRGLRVGTGPRGNYIHAGANGFYYRTTLPGGSDRRSAAPSPFVPHSESTSGLTEIESGDVLLMTDSSADTLLRELNEKHQKPQFWIWILGLTIAAALVLGPIALPFGVVLTIVVFQWDRYRRATVLLYDLETPAERDYQSIVEAFDQFAACAGTWHLQAEGATQDRKRNAGANVTVRRKRVQLSKEPPSVLRTNIDVPTLVAGRQTLSFLPDRLLVFDKSGVGAVSYAAINVDSSATRFIESQAVPSDATVVGQTWQFVNKNGGPDKRFSSNRQLPICLYEEIRFRSATGLNEAFQVSKVGVGKPLNNAIREQRATSALISQDTSST